MHIKVILGSIRNGRFGDKPAQWITDLVRARSGVTVELLDLKEYQLPPYAEAVAPSRMTSEYSDPVIKRWADKIAEADAFIVVTPEYNHGYSSPLKNNIDYLFKEWIHKPVSFVSYGSVGGARAVEQLRGVAIELQMAPIRNSVHIIAPWGLVDPSGALKPGALDPYVKPAENMLEQLIWWAQALYDARNKK